MVQDFGERPYGLLLALYKNEHRGAGMGSGRPGLPAGWRRQPEPTGFRDSLFDTQKTRR